MIFDVGERLDLTVRVAGAIAQPTEPVDLCFDATSWNALCRATRFKDVRVETVECEQIAPRWCADPALLGSSSGTCIAIRRSLTVGQNAVVWTSSATPRLLLRLGPGRVITCSCPSPIAEDRNRCEVAAQRARLNADILLASAAAEALAHSDGSNHRHLRHRKTGKPAGHPSQLNGPCGKPFFSASASVI